MHKFRVAIVAGLAAVAAFVPAGPAQAQSIQLTRCDEIYLANQNDGYMRAWRDINCSGTMLGAALGSDANWGDGAGQFTNDNDLASSVMNTGTYSGGLNVVKFYIDAGFSGGHTCLDREELYADNLTDNRFTTGQIVNDNITSHHWVFQSACARFVT